MRHPFAMPPAIASATSMLVAVLLCMAGAPASGQSVTYNGSMGDKGLLVIDGQLRMVPLGSTVQGVKLTSLGVDEARVEVGGKTATLHHGSPVNLGGIASAGAGREIVLTAGSGGHYWASGTINGRAVKFLLDTGATTVSLSAQEAERIGIDYKNGTRGYVNTANGSAPAWRVELRSLRIADVEVFNVTATVTPADMGFVLLGNTFLSRFQIKVDNDVMRLDKKP